MKNRDIKENIIILAIESSCDDTSAAVIKDGELLSNVMASQDVHNAYGGVVPELASRAHQQNIVPVVDRALKLAGVTRGNLRAIAFTRGPGLLGSLLVGTSFAKGLSLSLNLPLVDVNHLQGHLLSPFIKEVGKEKAFPSFPYISLLVSGGHTQIVRVDGYLNYTIIGATIDDAVGEAFDKCAKLLDLGYPGGPIIDRLSKEGNPGRFKFAKPRIAGYDFSFSGVKTSLLYFLRDEMKVDRMFIANNLNDLCASFQKTLIDILLDKLIKASKDTGINEIAITGGVSANSELRTRITEEGVKRGWLCYLPEIRFTTDNAAMIAVAGYYRHLSGYTATDDIVPVSRNCDF
jgi:putative glycoprotease GCP